MVEVALHNISKSFGNEAVIDNLNLTISSGELVVFVGPSGCGKSTLLRLIAGLEDLTDGDILLDGETVDLVPPAKRGIAMVFQSYALYPHMTVRENIAFGMKLAKEKKIKINEKVRMAAAKLELTEHLEKLPKQLSGGQRQRVAIGRAIVRDPQVFLFDEPLSNLDASLRAATRLEIAKLHDNLPETTMIYVTHDQVEAMTLADRIVVLNKGFIEQVGTPEALYHNPLNLFVATFIGTPAMNILPCRLDLPGVSSSSVKISRTSIEVQFETVSDQPGAEISLGLRPEHIIISNQKDALIDGHVEVVEPLGEFTVIYVDCGFQDLVIAKLFGTFNVLKGDTVGLNADLHNVHLFDPKGKVYKRTSNLNAGRISEVKSSK